MITITYIGLDIEHTLTLARALTQYHAEYREAKRLAKLPYSRRRSAHRLAEQYAAGRILRTWEWLLRLAGPENRPTRRNKR